MMMELNYPKSSNAFYKPLLEFVNFDLIETEGPYNYVFNFENVPYSDQIEEIGYESRYTIPNLGSIPIFMIIILL